LIQITKKLFFKMSKVELIKLNKVFESKIGEDVIAVNNFNMNIEHGEIVALLGSSGCGKTTTLRMIAGFETCTDGEIKLDGEKINHLKPSQRNVAMAFEGYALYPPLTVSENISFGLIREKISKSDINKKVDEVINLLEIKDIVDRYPPTISAGQQQRVSLARALVRNSKILLLDEPMSQLEPQLRAVLRARVKDYMQHMKKTVVFVTHDQTEAIALADKIAVMELGDLKQLASPYDISAKPENVFVASFIGEPPMNILKAEYIKKENNVIFKVFNENTSDTFNIKFSDNSIDLSKIKNIINNQIITLGIRPHKIDFTSNSSNIEGNTKIFTSHWLGDQMHVGININNITVIGVAERDFNLKSDSIKINFPSESLNAFDKDTEEVIFNGL